MSNPREIPSDQISSLAGWIIKAADKGIDDKGYPYVELLLMGHGGFQTVRLTADGDEVTDLIVTIE